MMEEIKGLLIEINEFRRWMRIYIGAVIVLMVVGLVVL